MKNNNFADRPGSPLALYAPINASDEEEEEGDAKEVEAHVEVEVEEIGPIIGEDEERVVVIVGNCRQVYHMPSIRYD